MRRPAKPAQGGFTLMEVVLTVLITSMMLVSISRVLTAARRSRDMIHNLQEDQLAGPAILDLLERDLRGLITYNIPPRNHLRVINNVSLGLDGDRIDFMTTTDSLLWQYDGDRATRADYNEVGYCLRPNPKNDDFLEIYRREGWGVDDDPFSEGEYIFLHDRVKGFDILVFSEDGIDAEPFEEWNTDSSDAEEEGLPTRLEISLTLELAPRLSNEQIGVAELSRREVTYKRVVRLPESLRLAADQTPRLAIPTIPSEQAEATTAGPGGAAGGEGEDGAAGGAAGGGRGGASDQKGGGGGGTRNPGGGVKGGR